MLFLGIYPRETVNTLSIRRYNLLSIIYNSSKLPSNGLYCK